MVTNVNRPFGFRPAGYNDGSAWTGATVLYGFSTNQANNAYKGDAIVFDATNRATGLTDAYASGIPLATPLVAGTTTTAFRGVIAGFVPQPEFNNTATASLGTMYRLLSTARYAWVVQDYNVVFEAQENGNSWTSTSVNAIGKTSDLAYTAGNATTGISGAQLASSDIQSAAARPFRYLRYTQRPDNFGFVAADANSYAHFDVLISNSDLAQANVGA